jgi:hypothetical protein
MSAEVLASPISDWARHLRLIGETLTDQMIVSVWIAGLRATGIKAEKVKVWERGRNYPTVMPFVIEFPCPFEHRTADRRGLATVRLLIEDDGWASVDPDSPCEHCSIGVLEAWLLTCPRCEAGEESARHEVDHDLHQYESLVDGQRELFDSTAPLAFVLAEFRRLQVVAWARWWVEHTTEAVDALRQFREPWDYRLPSQSVGAAARGHLAAARRILDRVGVTPVASQEWTVEGAADWLDRQVSGGGTVLVPVKASQRAAWAAVEALPNRPPKNTIEAAQSLRKSRPAS